MKKFTLGKHHTDLRNISVEIGEKFFEFCLFSETRFIEYAHRTYDHFFIMYPVLISKIQRDVESEDSPTDLVEDRESSEKLLAQVIFVLNLLFMRELSHLITIFSKSSQTFDVLPFRGMCQFEKLKISLSKARDELKSGKAPKSETLQSPHRKPFQLWQDFNDCTDILLKEQTFSSFKVLLPSERGRVTRSGSVFDCDPGSYSQLVKSCFVKYSNYIEILLFNLHCRFVPWSYWVFSCNSYFNF